MKFILTVRNRIETFYNSHKMIVTLLMRFLVSFFVLLAVRNNLGYNIILSQYWFIIAFSAVCAFINERALTLVLAGYSAMQIMTLSIGVGLAFFITSLIMYLLYFRINAKYGYALVLLALLHVIKVPLIVPLVLAIISPFYAIIVVLCGNVLYYMLHYINLNAAVITGYAEAGEVTQASVFINGMLANKEFICTTLIMVLIFLIVWLVRKIDMNNANDMAVAIGAGANIIFMLLISIILNTLSFPKLRSIIVGSAVAFIIALFLEKFILPLDFAKEEFLEFEDEEYHYFVRAVPKVTLDKEKIRITKISSRKKTSSGNAAQTKKSGERVDNKF